MNLKPRIPEGCLVPMASTLGAIYGLMTLAKLNGYIDVFILNKLGAPILVLALSLLGKRVYDKYIHRHIPREPSTTVKDVIKGKANN